MLAHPVERARAASCVVLRSLLRSSYSSLLPISSHLHSRFVLFLIPLAPIIFHHLFHFYIPFFFLLLASFPFFSFFCFFPCSFFFSFSMDSPRFSRFRCSSLLSFHRGILACFTARTSCSSSLFFPANFFDVRDTLHTRLSFLSRWIAGALPLPPPPFFSASRCYTRSTLSLDSVRAAKMRWPRRRTSEESGGADSGVSNEGSCRSRDIAADRTAKWNSN